MLKNYRNAGSFIRLSDFYITYDKCKKIIPNKNNDLLELENIVEVFSTAIDNYYEIRFRATRYGTLCASIDVSVELYHSITKGEALSREDKLKIMLQNRIGFLALSYWYKAFDKKF